jgi:hypothetical protein
VLIGFFKSLDSVLDILFSNEHKEGTRELLNTRIETLLSRLELIAKGRARG